MRRLLLLAGTLVALAGPASAQDPEPAQIVGPTAVRIGEAIYKVFSAPIHPTVEPVAPGGGLTGGVGISPRPWRRDTGLFAVEGRASVSMKKYWATEGSTWWQGSDTYRLEAYGRARSMRELDFYGLGAGASRDDRSNVHLTDRSLGGFGWYRPVPWVGVGGRLERLWPEVARGRNADLPSIETRFDEASAPGLAEQPSMLRGQVFVDINYPNQFERARSGGDYQVGYNVYSDREASRYSFRRFTLEMQQRFGLGPRPGQLTLHLLMSTAQTDAGQAVPFYLMPTLGGSQNLMAFNEQIIGGDQTIATLRGVDDFRFRDRNLLLMQAEYRFTVWGPVQGTVFVDAGQVAPEVDDWALGRLTRSGGFSLSLMRSNSTVLRFDFAFGAGEGFKHFMTPGRVLAP